jgi:hypothetical protein
LDSASIFHGLEPGLHAGPYLKGTIGTTSNLVRQLKGLEVGLDSRSSVSLGRVQPGLRGLEVWFPRRPFRSSSSRQHLFPSQLSCYASSLCPPLHMEASNAKLTRFGRSRLICVTATQKNLCSSLTTVARLRTALASTRDRETGHGDGCNASGSPVCPFGRGRVRVM